MAPPLRILADAKSHLRLLHVVLFLVPRRPRPIRRKNRHLPLWLESLEARVVPANLTWTGGTGIGTMEWHARAGIQGSAGNP